MPTLQAIKQSFINMIPKPAISKDGYRIDEGLLFKRIKISAAVSLALFVASLAYLIKGVKIHRRVFPKVFELACYSIMAIFGSVVFLDRWYAGRVARANVSRDFKGHPFYDVYKKIHNQIMPPSKFQEPFIDFECPQNFTVKGAVDRREFHIFSDNHQTIGSVVNPGYGVFEFYDSKGVRKCINYYDALYDSYGTPLANVRVKSDIETQPTSRIELFTITHKFLSSVDKEEGNTFIFKDDENNKIAKAQWNDTQREDSWSVSILDRSQIDKKKIPVIFMIWSLLKHSQKFFPMIPYVKRLGKE